MNRKEVSLSELAKNSVSQQLITSLWEITGQSAVDADSKWSRFSRISIYKEDFMRVFNRAEQIARDKDFQKMLPWSNEILLYDVADGLRISTIELKKTKSLSDSSYWDLDELYKRCIDTIFLEREESRLTNI